MDIVCAKTGRHFINVEAARKCAEEHNHCETCPYDKKYRKPIIHFSTKGIDIKKQQEIDKLMSDINSHLKTKKQKESKRIKPSPIVPPPRIESDRTIHTSNYSEIPISPKKPKTLNKKPIPKPLIKLILNLLILVGLVLLVKYGYQLFTSKPAEPLKESINLIIGLALWVAIIKLSKSRSRHHWIRYKGTKPSFKLTTFIVVLILLILAFAGVQPLADYKDNLVGKWEAYQAKQATQLTEQGAEITTGQQTEQEVEEPRRAEEARITREQTEEARREEKLKQEIEQRRLVTVEHFAVLFNEYRRSCGLNTLTFTDDLNKRATLRLPELELDFSHNSLGNFNLHLAENITWASFTLDNKDAFLSWKGSPGHNANMLNADYKYTGYAIDGGYAVQLFSSYPTVNGEPQLPLGWHWDD